MKRKGIRIVERKELEEEEGVVGGWEVTVAKKVVMEEEKRGIFIKGTIRMKNESANRNLACC